tara:strand:- start:370 stop:657 length:288 start_codon:yes stop_codon:yes gene_type:complete
LLTALVFFFATLTDGCPIQRLFAALCQILYKLLVLRVKVTPRTLDGSLLFLFTVSPDATLVNPIAHVTSIDLADFRRRVRITPDDSSLLFLFAGA